LIEEVIAAHPAEYLPADGWQEMASKVLKEMLPTTLARLLDEFLAVRLENQESRVFQPEAQDDERHLGF
jgi:hypothetical protein